MRMYDIIKKKRDGIELSEDEIEFAINGYTNDDIPDYQMSALLMAIYFKGMNNKEILNLTEIMAKSGDLIDLSEINGIKIDKHSTGGVGDTVTLVLGPLVAACGIPFVKTSGRGLGHTGGTIDKLESIKGFKVNLEHDEFINNVNDINIAITGQTGNIAPADGKIYALRDVTATVDSLPLIASSIMSKKLSLNSDGLVLDVKVGSGAFMESEKEAVELAEAMVNIGKGAGKNTVALVTNMDEPLGNAIGNNLEVIEAINTLNGKGPKDLERVSIELAIEILLLSKKYNDREMAEKKLYEVLDNGKALNKMIEMVDSQKGSVEFIKDISLFSKAEYIIPIYSEKEGYISNINAEKVGTAASILGAGREELDSELDLTAGLELNKKVDDKVNHGDLIYILHTNDKKSIKLAKKVLDDAISIEDKFKGNKKQLIIKKID